MGCKPTKKINENSNVQRRLRIGIGLKKGEDGNYHFGLEAGYEKKKDCKITETPQIQNMDSPQIEE